MFFRKQREAAIKQAVDEKRTEEIDAIKELIKPLAKNELTRIQTDFERIRKMRAAQQMDWVVFWRAKGFKALRDIEIKAADELGHRFIPGEVLYVVTDTTNEYDPFALRVVTRRGNLVGYVPMNDDSRAASWSAIADGHVLVALVKEKGKASALLLEKTD
ncbi:HIRAN domain-containing protein [Slackia heliotrinireducens]|uniref:HIRAN domain-containing protein n=1 Tax=Slackia heliotrinireducens (strain ATCC 29202 / DSM 20476 / NCTC 11029 / RHS 1) TaxID=471855 RepID=C7N528_SLAHD|nr:HIRAN domain-containing protein [Slackia heliotrinireducens]ACV22013.1 hypothetical protein Shel_09760 [Slackia heliotrinireducens DSM 20476]VEG99927.1 Uncharacterised protein [Slackia heliotrinireducens]